MSLLKHKNLGGNFKSKDSRRSWFSSRNCYAWFVDLGFKFQALGQKTSWMSQVTKRQDNVYRLQHPPSEVRPASNSSNSGKTSKYRNSCPNPTFPVWTNSWHRASCTCTSESAVQNVWSCTIKWTRRLQDRELDGGRLEAAVVVSRQKSTMTWTGAS